MDIPKYNDRGWTGLHPISKHSYEERYFIPGETYDEWLSRVCETYADNEAHSERLKTYIQNYWLHPATPISSNAGLPKRGLPISCFVHKVADTKDGIFKALEEDFFLASRGAGIGTDWSSLRESGASIRMGGKASGAVPFVKVEESLVNSVSQGGVRRGSFSPATRIDNPDILNWIQLKNNIGDPTLRALESFPAVIISDEFMEAVLDDKEYSLISPKSGLEVRKAKARDVWDSIIKMRMEKGVPFIMFDENTNKKNPDIYKALKAKVTQSNLCQEITLETTEDKANVCVLSSINMEYYKEFQPYVQVFYRDVHKFLDNVVEAFIQLTDGERGFERARLGAMDERPLGIGVMGLSYLYQREGYPFESISAKSLNKQIFKEMSSILEASNKELAEERGSCPMAERAGIMKRNSHLTAIAPTASISTLANLSSPGIDPLLSNIFTHKTNLGDVTIVNKYLKRVIKGMIEEGSITKTWKEVKTDIIQAEGSIQDIEYIPQVYKDIFKTAYEIPQQAIIELASDRTPYITQSQSVNLFIARGTSREFVSQLHLLAWAKGMKTLYYIRGQASQASIATKIVTADRGIKDDTKVVDNAVEECFYCG